MRHYLNKLFIKKKGGLVEWIKVKVKALSSNPSTPPKNQYTKDTKSPIDPKIVVLGDFNTPLSPI
jgi:hypothetical protein